MASFWRILFQVIFRWSLTVFFASHRAQIYFTSSTSALKYKRLYNQTGASTYLHSETVSNTHVPHDNPPGTFLWLLYFKVTLFEYKLNNNKTMRNCYKTINKVCAKLHQSIKTSLQKLFSKTVLILYLEQNTRKLWNTDSDKKTWAKYYCMCIKINKFTTNHLE